MARNAAENSLLSAKVISHAVDHVHDKASIVWGELGGLTGDFRSLVGFAVAGRDEELFHPAGEYVRDLAFRSVPYQT